MSSLRPGGRETSSSRPSINYRMSPENAACLTEAGVDCCALANNHVLDWGRAGLIDTLNALDRLGFKTAGGGGGKRPYPEASEPPLHLGRGSRRVAKG
jgi:poly-gamma-glutamate synthesis protein (capsule biosynthesis protein)